MDNFGDLFGGLGEILGEMLGEQDEGVAGGLAAMLAPERRRRSEEAIVPIVYARYLCGGPRELDVNDR